MASLRLFLSPISHSPLFLIGRGGKRLEDIGPCLRGKRTRRGLKTFFNNMSSKKQTACRAKRLCMVCAAHT
ncbi:hypothetical protein Hanom_Chr15g01368531 [Helianthus anomalus]